MQQAGTGSSSNDVASLKAATEARVAEFIRPGGLGETLQQRLLDHEATQPNSWLEDWWLKMAYHSWRESSMINSNW